jgi:hypothetical protein
MMQATAAMSAYWFVLRNGGWHFGDATVLSHPGNRRAINH